MLLRIRTKLPDWTIIEGSRCAAKIEMLDKSRKNHKSNFFSVDIQKFAWRDFQQSHKIDPKITPKSSNPRPFLKSISLIYNENTTQNPLRTVCSFLFPICTVHVRPISSFDNWHMGAGLCGFASPSGV
jgi:hypothetical protein